MDAFNALLEMMRSGGAITQLEQDIAATVRELEKHYFDEFSVKERILENCKNHQDLFDVRGLLPLAMQNISHLDTPISYRYYLYSQLVLMMSKKLEGCDSGQ